MNKRILAVLAFAVALGCDPYSKAFDGAPATIGGAAADVTNLNPPQMVLQPSGAWEFGTVPYVPVASYPPDDPATKDVNETHEFWVKETTRSDRPVDGTLQPAIFVFLNKVMDGATVQKTTTDCTPTNGWLNVVDNSGATCGTGGPAPTWYSCYDPGSPVPGQGATIVFYRSCNPSGGWADAEPLQQDQTYTLTGTIKDRAGTDLAINVVVKTAATPADPAPPAP